QTGLDAVPAFVEDERPSVRGLLRKRPDHHRPVSAAKLGRRVGDRPGLRQRADPYAVPLHKLALGVRLVSNDLPRLRIDEKQRPVEGFAPKLSAVVVRSPFGFLKVAGRQLEIDGILPSCKSAAQNEAPDENAHI